MTPEERFWAKVDKSAGPHGCWMWTACRARRQHNGALSYGHFRAYGRNVPAHRFAWEQANGPIPDGLLALHECDSQGCVNPAHLYLGTHADNTRDAVMRHRMAAGEAHPSHRLREVDVRAIRAMAEAGVPTETIGPIFGVSGSTARKILRGEAWRRVA